MEYTIKHSMPGRMRLHIPALKRKAALGELLAAWLTQQEHVSRVRINRYCSAVIVEFASAAAPVWLERLQRIQPQAIPAPEQHKKSCLPGIRAAHNGQPEQQGQLRYASFSLGLTVLRGTGLTLNVPLVLWNAIPIWRRALLVLLRERRLNVDFLDGLSIVIALIQGNVLTATVIIWLISLGDWIRDKTAAKSRRAMAGLLEFQGRGAWVLREGKVLRVPAADVLVSEEVLIYAGEMIPVDGEVISGSATVDQKTITGEGMPVLRREGERVYAGTVVREGKVRVMASRVGADTTAAQIVSLVESAPVTETKVQNYAEKFADHLVAPWLAVTCGTFAVTRNLDRLLSMTIIDYGTGIRVAAPTSILAYMALAARRGILIKGGSQMEKLAQADTLIFDKTGTLTRGTPHVVDVRSYDERRFPTSKILQVAAAVEVRVKHPIAEAIVTRARECGLTLPERSASRYSVGMGMEARVNGYFVHLGNSRFMKANGVRLDRARTDLRRMDESGCSVLMMAADGELVGVIPCRDQIRPESREVIQALRRRGIQNVLMVTGDSPVSARNVCEELGVDRAFAETLPADKAEIVKRLQREGHRVVMVGDGINDSPALAYADVGIAMKNGADVAQESADVVLMEDNLWKLPAVVELSHAAMGLIRQNYWLIAGLNTLAVALALPAGLVSPGAIAAISNGSAILASLNAVRPLLGGRQTD